MKIAAVFLLLLFMGTILFAVFIYPVWSLVHCATSGRNKKSKTWWIVLMILIWPTTGLVYGLFAAKNRALRWLSGLQIIGLVILISGYVVSINLLSQLTNLEINKDIARIETLNTEGIKKEDLEKIKKDLYALKSETAPKLLRTEPLRRATSFTQLFEIITKDNKITVAEYNIWMERFAFRDNLDPRAFDNYVRGLKTK